MIKKLIFPCSSNFLNEVTANNFRYNQAMTSLSLDNNHIGNIDPTAFQGIPKLRKLHLQNNVLRTIKRQMFASLTSLTELDLGNNRISNIEAQSFSGLANLRELNLLGNRLPKLDDIMMRYPSTLNAMYLDQNKLVSFHRETFSGQVRIQLFIIPIRMNFLFLYHNNIIIIRFSLHFRRRSKFCPCLITD